MNTNQFSNRHIGTRVENLPVMLDAIGAESLEKLIQETVPEEILLKNDLKLDAPLSEYEFSKKTLEYEKASLRQRWLIFSAFAGLLVFLVILFIVSRNRNKLNTAYHTLQEKTIEIGNKNEIARIKI